MAADRAEQPWSTVALGGVPGVVGLGGWLGGYTGWVGGVLYRYPASRPSQDPYLVYLALRPYLRPNEGLFKIFMRFLR